MTLTTEVWN